MATDRRERILDTSLELAATAGWDRLRLYQVADRLGLALAAVHAEFRDRDALADAGLRGRCNACWRCPARNSPATPRRSACLR